MSLHIYNSLSQKLEKFEPLKAGRVTMYVCGPTVYSFVHVGNMRGPIFFNLVRNWFEKSGYQVEFALNFTDVDDKIIDRAKADGVDSATVSEKFIEEYKSDFQKLKLRPHTHNPKVTDYMDEIIKMVEELVNKERAYVVEGEVLYAVRKFSEYGKLSHKNVDDLQSGARVEVDGKKRDPLDFALWKPAKPGEPNWLAPWSEGRPGWHIECSAMVRSIFGDAIDIHGGGMDLIFPHHENEIAQSEGVTAKPFVKYWMHNNMLTFGDKKMSKSLGNVTTARDFLTQYNGEILKFMMLSVHYRSLTDFSEKQIMNAVAGLARIYSALARAGEILATSGTLVAKPAAALTQFLQESDQKIKNALDDDFNTPEMFAAIYSAVRFFNAGYGKGGKLSPEALSGVSAWRDWIYAQGQLLSLFQEPPAEYLTLLDDMLLERMHLARADIDALVAERVAARTAKDFKRSDELRDKLNAMGILLQDGLGGTKWEVDKTRPETTPVSS